MKIELGERVVWVAFVISLFTAGVFFTFFGTPLTSLMAVYLQTIIPMAILWRLNDIHRELKKREELERAVAR